MWAEFKRWWFSCWRGPLCDAGTGLGARPGCLKTATHTTLFYPEGWSRGFRWCDEHEPEAEVQLRLKKGEPPYKAKTPPPIDAEQAMKLVEEGKALRRELRERLTKGKPNG